MSSIALDNRDVCVYFPVRDRKRYISRSRFEHLKELGALVWIKKRWICIGV